MRSDHHNSIRKTPWSFTIGSVSGIPVKVHATFGLLLFWVATEQHSTIDAVSEILFVLGIFSCVLLHELGHALVARKFGLGTRDIVLYPIGGIASLIGRTTPWSELWIAIAGPIVNLLIAALLYPCLQYYGLAELDNTSSSLVRLFVANVFIAVFNMIPAIPMDGGRVLRAVLALLHIRSATAIASRVSQILSLLLGASALYIGNPILVVIAAFVFMNAMQELVQERTRLGAIGRIVSDVMVTRSQLQTFSHGMTVTEALDVALKSMQPAFPVLFGEQVLGVISREELLQEAAMSVEEQYISGFMHREFLQATPDEEISSLLARTGGDTHAPILVLKDDHLVGIVHHDKLIEFLFLHGVRKARSEKAATGKRDPLES